MKGVAISWVLKTLKDKGISANAIRMEQTRLLNNDQLLADWCFLTNFKEIKLPDQINFDTIYATVCIEIEGYGEVEIRVTDYSIEGNGIGAYEYWGSRGYDRGTPSVVVEELGVVSVESGDIDYLEWYLNHDLSCEVSVNEVPDQDCDYEPDYEDDYRTK